MTRKKICCLAAGLSSHETEKRHGVAMVGRAAVPAVGVADLKPCRPTAYGGHGGPPHHSRLQFPTFLALCLLACLSLGLARTASATPKPTLTEVSRELMCDCPDCGHQSIDQCPAGCAYGKKYRAELTAMIEQGKSKDEIINAFADKHGEHMLGNPRPHGIGLMAPIVPWVGTLTGLLLVMLILRHMTKRKRLAPAPAGTRNLPVPEDPRLSAALHDFDY